MTYQKVQKTSENCWYSVPNNKSGHEPPF